MAANGNHATRATGPRCVALVGPFQSGKTTLLEAILARTGVIPRQGNVEAGNTVGDASTEARHHHMSVELSVATANFMGDTYTFLDCPGSVEFVHDMRAVLPAIDAAVVVCEMDEKKVPQLQLILRELEDQKIPRILFLNKIDKADAGVHDVLNLLAGRLAHQADPAANPDLLRRHHHRLCRSRARARLCLQGARCLGSRRARRRRRRPREDGALLHAGNARRSRRRADGAVARRHPAAARQGVRRPHPRTARRSGLPGADGNGDARQRRVAAAQGAAPRGARHCRNGQAPRRQGSRHRRCRLCAQDPEHHAWRQDVDRSLAGRPSRRRHDLLIRRRRGRPRRRRLQARRSNQREARPGDRRRDCGICQARQGQDRRHAHRREAGRIQPWPRSSPIRRCSPSRSRPRSARTT